MTCDAHFRTWLKYSSQKSYVKIWFGLVEPFKSYRSNKQTNKKIIIIKIKETIIIKQNHRHSSKQYLLEKIIFGWIIKQDQTQLKIIPPGNFFFSGGKPILKTEWCFQQ